MPSRLGRLRLGRVLRALAGALRALIARLPGRRPRARAEPIRAAWPALRASVDDFYRIARPRLLEGATLDPAELESLATPLDAALTASERIRHEAVGALAAAREDEHDDVTALLLAAATVDAMLAADIAAVDPELVEYRRDADEPLETVDAERDDILRDADQLFSAARGLVAGGQSTPDSDVLTREVHDVVDRLVSLAGGPADEIGRGLTSLAVGGLLDLVGIDIGEKVEKILRHIRRSWALRFVREHALKLLELRAPDWAADKIIEEASNSIDFGPALAGIAGASKAKSRVAGDIAGTGALSADAKGELMAALSVLEHGYENQIKWLEGSARWVRRGSWPLSHLLAPVGGPVVVGAVFVAGGCYVAYSLTDRLDARDLGVADRVVGVVKLVEKHIGT